MGQVAATGGSEETSQSYSPSYLMLFQFILHNPHHIRIALIILGVALALTAYILHVAKRTRRRAARIPPTDGSDLAEGAASGGSRADESAGAEARPDLVFKGDDPLLFGFFRSLLVLLAIVVAAGFCLTLLPQSIVQRLSQSLRLARTPPDEQEMVAFLYLGDEIAGGDFHIRGVVRNITTEPIENMDAAIRLYSPEGILIETVIVRMETETIAPDATSGFHLRYAGYRGQFASYSVDFKLRSGAPVPYKDMRTAHTP